MQLCLGTDIRWGGLLWEFPVETRLTVYQRLDIQAMITRNSTKVDILGFQQARASPVLLSRATGVGAASHFRCLARASWSYPAACGLRDTEPAHAFQTATRGEMSTWFPRGWLFEQNALLHIVAIFFKMFMLLEIINKLSICLNNWQQKRLWKFSMLSTLT